MPSTPSEVPLKSRNLDFVPDVSTPRGMPHAQDIRIDTKESSMVAGSLSQISAVTAVPEKSEVPKSKIKSFLIKNKYCLNKDPESPMETRKASRSLSVE